MNQKLALELLKGAIWTGALAPLIWMVLGYRYDWLGANPIEKITHLTGKTALVLLLATLMVTPVRRLSKWNRLLLVRRLLGLFSFFYVSLHFAIWAGLDMTLMLAWMAEDIAERPYVTVGFAAFLILIPLAVTSTKGWIRRLGPRWTLIHKGIYPAAALGAIHFYWIQKADFSEPLLFGVAFGVLFGYRIVAWRNRRSRLSRQDVHLGA